MWPFPKLTPLKSTNEKKHKLSLIMFTSKSAYQKTSEDPQESLEKITPPPHTPTAALWIQMCRLSTKYHTVQKDNSKQRFNQQALGEVK